MTISRIRAAGILFTLALLYIAMPWFFEKKLLLNEILSAAGLLVLSARRFRIGYDPVSICVVGLLALSAVHLIVSLFRMDSLYLYFRNAVIAYSMFTFFIGFYLLKYLPGYLNRVRILLRTYIGLFLIIRLPRTLFERFGIATLFPALPKDAKHRWLPWLLLGLNLLYGVQYSSLTAWIIAAFYFLLFISPGYKFFMRVLVTMVVAFVAVFIYLQPYLSLIRLRYSYYDYNGIQDVMRSNPLLRVDGNSTWRLVLWKQVIVDHFPSNLFGLGFGTPMFRYFPIEDYSKLSTLPYVLGAHNSFVYLFGRLGILFVPLIVAIYAHVFRDYFANKAYYYANNRILLFWSFFAVTILVSFNPALESPIYAGAYWLLLGFVARAMYDRRYPVPAVSEPAAPQFPVA